jgi:CBS domain-containing protein
MTPDPVCVGPMTRARELARMFEEHAISGAPVLDHAGHIVGVVFKTDLLRRCACVRLPEPAYLFEPTAAAADDAGDAIAGPVVREPLVCVEDFMTPNPYTVSPDETVGEIARAMVAGRMHRAVVVDRNGFPVGIITSMDLLDALTSQA